MKWRVEYYKRRVRQILGNKDRLLEIYDRMVKESKLCKDTKFNRFDYLCSYILHGTEPEDYFSFNFFERRNPFLRNHHVTRTRLNFIKKRFNTPEAIETLTSKADFNRIYDEYLGRKWSCPSETDENTFVNTLAKDGGTVFVKLLSGFGGKGAFKAPSDAESLRKLYHELTEGEAKYIVEEYFDQTGFLISVNPSSLNTIRITTARVKGEVRILYAYFRAGGPGSAVDNIHSGGVRYLIDTKTGELLKGINYTDNNIEVHPSSGVRVAGHIISGWDEIVEFAKKLHLMAPEGANFIGWDLCVSDDKTVVIEGNAGPGFPQEVKFSNNSWKRVKKCLSDF